MSVETLEELSLNLRRHRSQTGTVAALVLGLYTSLFVATIYNIVLQRGIRAMGRPLPILLLAMYACAVLHVSTVWIWLRRAFVDHGSSEESTLQALRTSSVADVVLSFLSRGLLMLMADGIMIWRCWIIYGNSRAVIGIPVILATAQLATLLARLVFGIREHSSGQVTNLAAALVIAHLSMTLATTVLVTALIVYRIVHIGGYRGYRGIITIIVESAALLSVVLIIHLPSPFDPRLWDVIPSAVLTVMGGISSTLIIARVSLGRAIEHTMEEITTRSGTPADHRISARCADVAENGQSGGCTRDEAETK